MTSNMGMNCRVMYCCMRKVLGVPMFVCCVNVKIVRSVIYVMWCVLQWVMCIRVGGV